MGHPSFSRGQATIINVLAIAAIAATVAVGYMSIRSDNVEGKTGQAEPSSQIGMINTDRIIEADSEPGNWLAYGRDYSEQRHSPLTQVDKTTVKSLELAWDVDMYTTRGLESTPIVVDGIMYMTSSWSIVYAVDAKTGEEIWSYDPEVPGEWARKGCCDVVNRGVAVYEGAVYVASFDGYLISLNAETGEEVWRVNTLIDRERSYTITGAPRVANGQVYIGNGGAELGVRGYVTAYDAKSGDEVWRFYTVPGDPGLETENPALDVAMDTWKGGEWWKVGGGGTVWNSMVFDPDTNTLFIGVGNGSPWTRAIRSPGGGDNLYLSSIVALDASDGSYKWHYQTTPGDNWDYTAVQHMMLAELEIDGQSRRVIMQAPKNGFFYILDRDTGELLKANPFVEVNCGTPVELGTWRTGRNRKQA